MIERLIEKKNALVAEVNKLIAKVELLNEIIAEEEANTKAVEVTEPTEENNSFAEGGIVDRATICDAV